MAPFHHYQPRQAANHSFIHSLVAWKLISIENGHSLCGGCPGTLYGVHFTLVAHKWGPIKFKHLPAAARVFARTRSVQTHTEQRFDYVNQTTAGHCGFVVVITTSNGPSGSHNGSTAALARATVHIN